MVRKLRVGLALVPSVRWAQARQEWLRLEEAGFDHGWTYDHISWDPMQEGPWFSALPTLAAAAEATSDVELGALVLTPNLHHPVTLAQDLVTLADLSGERLVAAVGAGGTGSDSRMLGGVELSPSQRVARLTEFVDILARLLRHGRADAEGSYFAAVDARCPAAGGRGHTVPLAVAANGEKTAGLAARYGDIWVTDGKLARRGPVRDVAGFRAGVADLARVVDRQCRQVGRDPGSLRRIMLVPPWPESPFARRGALVETCASYAALGFTDVVVHAPRANSPFAAPPGALERAEEEELGVARSLEPAPPALG